MWESVNGFFWSVWGVLSAQDPLTGALDVLLVAFTVYNLIKLIRDSRAEQLIKGIFILAVAYAAASLFDLKTLHYLLKTVFDNALLVLVIIFQPEIRRALEHAGHSRGLRFGGGRRRQQAMQEWQQAIVSTVVASEVLRDMKMGALFVFERRTRLGEIIQTGTTVDAEAAPELMTNLFYNKAPLHDGAMILRDGRICAAGCFLPISDNPQISKELGTRHRAAVGMSENSDAMVVVVSEETGILSLAVAGELTRELTPQELKAALEDGMLREERGGEKKRKRRAAPPNASGSKGGEGT